RRCCAARRPTGPARARARRAAAPARRQPEQTPRAARRRARPRTPAASPSALQLVVDHALEGVEGLRAGEEAPVDEERRRARHAEAFRLLLVLRDARAHRLRLAVAVEALEVETQL